jgi:hypothetical protein
LTQIENKRAFHSAEEEGEDDGLGIGIGELPVVGIGKEERFDLGLQRVERRIGIFKGVEHLIPEQSAERGKKRGQLLWLRRNDRRPAEKIGEEVEKVARVLRVNGFVAVRPNVAHEPNAFRGEFAVVEKCPFVAVRVKNVRDALETLPLIAVMTFECLGPGALPWRFEFDVPDGKSGAVSGEVRPPEAATKPGFPFEDDATGSKLAEGSNELIHRALELVLWITGAPGRELLGEAFGEYA